MLLASLSSIGCFAALSMPLVTGFGAPLEASVSLDNAHDDMLPPPASSALPEVSCRHAQNGIMHAPLHRLACRHRCDRWILGPGACMYIAHH